MSPSKEILIVAGEASADRYGARLVRKLQALRAEDQLRFFGTGGDAMQREGVDLLSHVRDLASIGPREALSHFHLYYRTFRKLVEASVSRRPAVAVLLDFPDFNLRLAKRLKRLGIRVIYYISPQIWAWRRRRVRTVRRYVDKMLVILPFEEEFYRQEGVDVEFVGHPVLEEFSPDYDREGFCRRLRLDPERRTVALLPGSRRREVAYILPTLIETARRIRERTAAQFVISAAPSVALDQINGILAEVLRADPCAADFRVAGVDSRDILANSDFALVKSGTSTLEAALVGTPFLITYKISPLSWFIGNILIRSPFKGLVNLVANEEIVPEFLQDAATPEAMSRAALEYLESPEKYARMRSRLAEVRHRLSVRPASESAAATVGSYL